MAYNREGVINAYKTAFEKTIGKGNPEDSRQAGAEGMADFVEYLIDNLELEVNVSPGSFLSSTCVDSAPLTITATFKLNGKLLR